MMDLNGFTAAMVTKHCQPHDHARTATSRSTSGKLQICFFCFSKQKKREKVEKAGKLRHNQAGSTAIKREKHEKQRQFS